MIRCKVGSFPTDETDGVEVYFGNGNTCQYSGCNPGTTIYFCAWSYAGDTPSDDSADVMATTTAGTTSEDMATPSMPSGWFQAPDYTNMEGTPIYGMVNAVADSMQFPRATFWMLCYLVIIVLPLGIDVYNRAHNPWLVCILQVLLIIIGGIIKLLPISMAFVAGVLSLGIAWTLGRFVV
jgi:hypothetical protein